MLFFFLAWMDERHVCMQQFPLAYLEENIQDYNKAKSLLNQNAPQ
jgi:hypothetical protein